MYKRRCKDILEDHYWSYDPIVLIDVKNPENQTSFYFVGGVEVLMHEGNWITAHNIGYSQAWFCWFENAAFK